MNLKTKLIIANTIWLFIIIAILFFRLKEIKVGTINFGSGFLRSGMLINKNGILVGKDTTGIELFNITEAFPYLR